MTCVATRYLNSAINRSDIKLTGITVAASLSSLAAGVYVHIQLLITVFVPLIILIIGLLLLIIRKLEGINEHRKTKLSTQSPSSFSFEVYIDYNRLRLNQLGNLLSATERLFKLLYAVKEDWFSFTIKDDQANEARLLYEIDHDPTTYIERRLRAVPNNELLLDYIETGNSIRWRAKTGWKPTVTNIGDDTFIHVPTGPFVAFYVGLYVCIATKYGISSFKDIVDIRGGLQQQQKTQLEIENLKNQNVLFKKQEHKLDLEIKDLENKLHKVPNLVKKEIDRNIDIFLDITMRDETIIRYEVQPMAFGRTYEIMDKANQNIESNEVD